MSVLILRGLLDLAGRTPLQTLPRTQGPSSYYTTKKTP